MGNDMLSQDEIDALLTRARDEEVIRSLPLTKVLNDYLVGNGTRMH